MEHSYLGDLGMFIECPDGTSVTILDWGLNGGGGTFLGEAVDDGSTIPGTGWDYGWQPGNTNGNLDDGNSSQYTYVDNAGNQWNNAAIVDPGYYESDGDLCDLVGCPLNGTWTFNVTDNLAIDNGYIFSWGMEFNPSLYPDITTFTPVVGLGADSSWWEGPYIVDVSADGNVISFEPPALGFYDYTYVVTNNFGCQLDTTVTVEVVNGPVVDAGMDMTFCGDLQLGATIVSNELPMPPCQFTLSMYNVNGDFLGWDGGSVDVTVDGVYVGNYTTWGGTVDQPISINTGSSLEIYFYPSLWGGDDGAEFQILDDDGNVIYTSPTGPAEGLLFDEVITCVGPGQIVYEWSPSGGLSDGGVPNPFVEQVSGSTEFTVTAYPSDFPGCVTTDVVTIEPAFDFDVTSQSPSCAGNDGWVQVVVDGGSGTPPWTIEFYQNGALQSSTDTNGGTQNYNDLLPGDYMVSIINNQCTYDIDAELDEPGILIVELSPDTTICVGGVAALHASSPQDPDGSWTYFWDNGAGSGSTVYVDPDVATTYEVYAIDDFGCESAAFTVDVDIFDPLSLTAEGDIFICEDAETDLGVMDSDGGMGTPYTYTWTFNGQQIGTGYTLSYQPQQSGSYCVTITDQCESPAVQDCIEVTVEDPLVVQLESDTTKGCFPADIVFNVGNDPSTYSLASWQFSDGGFELNASQLDHTFSLPGVYDVGLTLVSPAGCVYEGWFENYITVYSNPTAGYHASPQPTTAPETTIDFFDYSLGSVVEWYWTFDSINNLGESFEQNPRFEFPIDHGGLYPVTLMVTDANGCVDRVTRWIEIHDIFNVFIPNTFTPNSDGFNDVLFVQGTDIDPNRFKFTVFDRWGEEVFETTDPSIAWTGSFQGGDHYTPDGMYIWHLIVYSISTAERHEITGHVNMIR
jgi:gliding motility-associated-like protein